MILQYFRRSTKESIAHDEIPPVPSTNSSVASIIQQSTMCSICSLFSTELISKRFRNPLVHRPYSRIP
ncbi:unnamed protein product, partial [Rotaria sp. Silwood2]